MTETTASDESDAVAPSVIGLNATAIEATARATTRQARVASYLIPVFFCLLGLFLMGHKQIMSGFALMQTDPGDTRFLLFVLEHEHRWMTGQLPEGVGPWDFPVFFPKAQTGAYGDTLLTIAPLYSLARFAGADSHGAFQSLVFGVFALNFFAFFWLLRRFLGTGLLASALGAYVYAYAGPKIVQLGHQQMLPSFPSILACIAVLYALAAPAGSRRRRGAILAFFLAAAAQAYAGYYNFWFFFLACSLSGLIVLAIPRYRAILLSLVRHDWLTILVGAGGFLLLLYPMLNVYLAAAAEVGVRNYGEVRDMLPRLLSWVNPGDGHWLYAWLHRQGTFAGLPVEPEHRLFYGPATLITAGVGLYLLRRRPLASIATSVAAIVFLLTLYLPTWDFSLWQPIHTYVPGAAALRAVARVALWLSIPIAIGVAWSIDRTLHGTRRYLAPLLMLAVIAEQVHSNPTFDKALWQARVAALAAKIDPSCDSFFYVAAPGEPNWALQIDAMLAAQAVEKPTVNGYSGNFPPGWRPLFQNTAAHDGERQALFIDLNAWLGKAKHTAKKICWIE